MFWNGGVSLAERPLTLADITVLNVSLRRLLLASEGGGAYLLTVEFAAPQTMDEARAFLQRVSDAFTVSLAPSQRDPWYGNLLLEMGWAGLRDASPRPPDTLSVEGSVLLTSEEGIAVSAPVLTELKWTPLTEIFAEGMRAGQPKSKFLFWFVMLEELEAQDEFRSLFTPLFSEAEENALLKTNLTAGAKDRLRNTINNPNATQEGRPVKLLTILHAIGLKQVVNIDGTIIEITEDICRSLIKSRNNIAHKGSAIDKDQLYTVLFPLSQGALQYLYAKL